MIDDAGFERLARSWIAEGPTDAPADTVRAALNEISRTSQDRVRPWPIGWLDRPGEGRSGARIALAVAATVAATAILASLAVIGGRPSPTPTPAPSIASPSPSPSPSESTGPPLDLPSTFTSERYGYTIGTGADWTAEPATLTWSGPDNSVPVLDELAVTGTAAFISGSSEALAPGQTFEHWLDLFQADPQSPCFGGPASTWPTVQIGAVLWRWEHTCYSDVALTEQDGRAYVFNAEYGSDPKSTITPAQFRQVLGTVRFDASSVPASPPPPELGSTFVSRRNGYSLRYPTGWSTTQATGPAPHDIRPAADDPSLDVLGDDTVRLTVTSLPLLPGETADDWMQTYCSLSRTKWSPRCAAAPADWPTTAFGSDSGWISTDGDGAGTFPAEDSRVYQAMAVKDGRAYEVRLEGAVGAEVIRGILASMALNPAAAVDAVVGSPAP